MCPATHWPVAVLLNAGASRRRCNAVHRALSDSRTPSSAAISWSPVWSSIAKPPVRARAFIWVPSSILAGTASIRAGACACAVSSPIGFLSVDGGDQLAHRASDVRASGRDVLRVQIAGRVYEIAAIRGVEPAQRLAGQPFAVAAGAGRD